MNITIQAVQLPEHYERMAQLLNLVYTEPTSAAILAEEDGKLYKQGRTSLDHEGKLIGYDRIRLAALSPDGLFLGYANGWRAPWTEPGTLHNTVVVDNPYRGQGIGARLLQALEQWAHELKASEMTVVVSEEDEASLRFAENRGFAKVRHTFKSSILPEHFKEDATMNVEQRLRAEGIRFTTLLEEPGEENEVKLHELYRQADADIPGNQESYPSLSEWKKWVLARDGSRPELVLIAAEGDRYVGVVHLLHNAQTGGMYHEFTGVDREYRGRHIALALKIQAIRVAQRLNAPYMNTHNDSANAPMLAINRNRLGYLASPGHYRMVKALRTD